MAWASVRTYQSTATASATPPGGAWTHAGNRTWQIRPTLWPFISAFVVRRPHAPPTLVSVAAEVALLLENTNWRNGEALSWSSVAMSCPSHMSRFLTESLGLCIAVESASSYGWHPRKAILDADRLRSSCPLYVPAGSRPDFVVQTTKGWHGIEARGRGSSGPTGLRRPVAAQNKKLKGMSDWAANVVKNPLVPTPPSWSMSWAWITDGGTSIDHFDPGDAVELGARGEQAIWREMSDIASALAMVDDRRIRHLQAFDRPISIISRRINDHYGDERSAWLSVACWSERLNDNELENRWSPSELQETSAKSELRRHADVAVGAFMAVAITDRPTESEEIVSLLEAVPN